MKRAEDVQNHELNTELLELIDELLQVLVCRDFEVGELPARVYEHPRGQLQAVALIAAQEPVDATLGERWRILTASSPQGQ